MSNLAEAQRAAGATEGGEPPPDEPKFVKRLRRIDGAFARVEEVSLFVWLSVLILVGVYGALKRNFFPPAPYWSFEIIRYSVFFLGLSGAALATQGDRLFNIDSFTRLFSARGRLIIRILTATFTIVACLLVLGGSLRLRAILAGEKSEVIPPDVAALAIPIAFVLIILHVGLHVAIDVYYLVTGKLPAELAHAPAPKA